MKKILLLFLAVGMLAASCENQKNQPFVRQHKNPPPQAQKNLDRVEQYRSERYGFSLQYPTATFQRLNIPNGIRLGSRYQVTLPDSKSYTFSIDYILVSQGLLETIKQTSSYAFSQMFPKGSADSFVEIGGFSRRIKLADRAGYSFLSYGAIEEGVNFLPANLEYYFLPKSNTETLVIKFRSITDPGKPPIPERKQRALFESVLASLKFDPAGNKTNSSSQEPANRIASIRFVASSPILQGRTALDIEVTSPREFPVRNEFVALHIGNQKFLLSRYPDNGDLYTLIFTLSKAEFGTARTGEKVWVQYGNDPTDDHWDFGLLNKALLK